MDRNDIFGVLGNAPAARIAEGTISRLDGFTAYVIVPSFDDGLEFQANYAGARPSAGEGCVVAIMTETSEAWIISLDGPRGGPLQPIAEAANYSALPGDLVLMSGAHTVALPPPASGSLVGVKSVNGTGSAPCTISTASGVILGPGVVAAATSILLGTPGSFVVLEADGTNWHIIDGQQDSGWLAFPFSGGQLTSLGGNPCQYRKRGATVVTQGLLAFVSGSPPWGLGTFPVGYRPLNNAFFVVPGTVASGYAAYALTIDGAGVAALQQNASQNWSGTHAGFTLAYEVV